MRDHENGCLILAVHGLDALEQQAGVLGIERAGGLIGQDDGRVGHQGAGRGHALLLAAGHLIRILVEHPGDIQTLRDLLHPGKRLLGGDAGDGERQGDVLAGRQRIEQVGVLENEAQLLATETCELGMLHARDVGAVDDHVAARHGIDGGHAVEQGGLAGSRGAHDAHELALVNREGHIGQRSRHVVAAAVHLLDVIDLEHGHARSHGGTAGDAHARDLGFRHMGAVLTKCHLNHSFHKLSIRGELIGQPWRAVRA